MNSISHTRTVKKYYDSYGAFKMREEVISYHCPEMIEKKIF